MRPTLASALALLAVAAAPAAAQDQRQVLRFGRGQDAVRLDPADVTDGESIKAVVNLYEGLVRYREGSTEVEPALATRWSTSEDKLAWTFWLRDGVRFHDGTPLDAEAVILSFERQRDSEHPLHAGDFVYWNAMFPDVAAVTTGAEPGTVVIRLTRPYAPFLASLAMPFASIISPAALRRLGTEIRNQAAGTGPFRLGQWRRNESLRLVANDDYWDGRPALDEVVLKVVPDNTARLRQIEKGDLDLMDGVNPRDFMQAQKAGALEAIAQPGMNVAYLAFNNLRAPFDDVRVRRACALALNLPLIAEKLYYGLAEPAKNPLPPTLWGHHDALPARVQDVERARALVAEAGCEGRAVELWTMSNPRPYMPEPEKMAIYIKGALGKIGLAVTIRKLEWASYLEKTEAGEHDMCLLGWTGDNGDPDNFLYVLLDKDNTTVGQASNVSFYRGEEVHALLQEAQAAPQEQREALYLRAQERISEDVPMVPLVHTLQTALHTKRLKGFRLHPTGIYRFRGARLE